ATQELVISNSGSGSLQITNIWFSNDAGTPSGVFSTSQTPPLLVVKMSEYPVDIKFSPLARVHYGAWVYFRASSGRVDSVRLTGDGAEPILFITDTTLYFGTVRSGRTSVRYDTIRNTGNWTAHVVSATLGCSNAAAYSVEPNDATFLLDAGTMRVYTITFHPSTMSDNHLTACLSFYFDNAIQPKIIYLSGDEQRPRITYDAKSVDFGTVRIGDTEHRSLMLTNSSLAAQNFSDSINLVNMWWLTGAFQLVGPAPAVLAAGRDSLDLTFTPKGDGPASGWLHMNVNGQIDSIYLYGNGARPMPAFTPPVLSFGVLPTDSMGKQSTFIKDTGDYPMSICNVQIVGDTDFKLVSTLQLPDSLHNGSIDSLRVSVTFVTTSRTGNTHYATLEITYCDGTKDDVPLIAKEAAQFVQFSTAGIDFGKVRVGYNNPKLATFSNGAQIPLSVGTIWATPTGGPFTPMQPSANVGANASASVTVTFAPLTRGAFTGYLHARDGDIKEDSIPLTGIGAAGVPVFSDSLIDFGTVTINTVSGDTELTLTNAGDWPLAARIVKTNDQYNEFTIITPSGDKVDRVALDSAADGGVRGYLVRFSPTHPELPYHEADLAFYFDDGTVSNVRIIGRDRSDFLALDSTSIDFGKVRVNTTSTRNIQVINTSLVALAVTQLQVNPGSEFSATPSGGLTVNSQSNSPIVVSFSPTAIGPAQAVLISHGKFLNNGNDTITLDGIGAQPVPILSTSLIDFGTRTIGTTSNEPFTLSNNGNWPLITSWTIAGPNAADFTPNMPADTSIDENGTANYSVNFLATTPMQFTPRTATITFKEDDGTTFSLDLTASDKAPLPAQIGFGSYAGRPGDKIFAYLKLSSAIPASLGIQHLSGSVQYDPTIASLISIGAGILDPSPNWNVKISNNLPGSFDYDISSLTDTLTGPGNLLMITFLIDANTQTGDVSTLTAMPVFPESKEVAAITQSGTITVENACGSTSIIAGEASATFVNQNTPNPFGGDARETNIPFDVGADNTIITLRILDPTGREIARPIDHQNFAQGRYSVSVSAKDLGTGVFFCEFRPEGKPPQITKMVVE
ncbi:MAG TPA: choice-of-anchor D domain-containing protein, partial [Candidatus Kapabacteria bacterium]|nr:choice-of-anchor D domain-containing protein [Candidatus Kapabacteria bacterium]